MAALITVEELMAVPVGHVFVDDYENGVRFLVLRGPHSVNAYVGVPKDHPLVRAAPNYDDLPLDVHGGFTYSGEGIKGGANYFWWGWDYAHLGDRVMYHLVYPKDAGDHLWTPDEVEKEARQAAWGFARLVRLAERAAR